MTIRTNIHTSHYREMFSESGSRLDPSSSAPGSSSAPDSSGPETVPETQSSQTVSRSPSSSAPHVPLPMALPVPPPMAPPMPAEIHPDLMVPPNITDTIKGNFSIPHLNWRKMPIYVRKTWLKIFAAKGTGQLPSLMQLYERTHKNKAGQFLDGKSEQIFNDLVAQVDDRQTQLTQQSTDGLPVTLSTHEVDKIYEEVVPKKKGHMLGIGSVNDVPSYGWTRGLLGRCSGHKCGMGVLVEELATTKSHSRRVIIRYTSRGKCREEE
uniref:Uncharacterized protein n=1 Tax=Brassica oleracea var. oleracea TaxID=109376 RepID=A0A0D3DJW2_BRAOL